MRKFSLIIFGATGFTGKHMLEEIVKTKRIGLSEEFTWAVAGRSKEKLDDVLAEMSIVTGSDLSSVEKIIADLDNYDSLREMARSCSVLVNTVGPYEFYGEVVIRACLQEGTHHVDISAESHNLTRMQIEYSKEAESKGIYIVGSCGFDSIPVDCGMNLLTKEFKGQLNSVESYLYLGNHLWTNKVHFGTWQSILRFYAQFRKLRPLLRQLYPDSDKFPESKFKLNGRLLHRNNVGATGWCIPFPAPDVWAVERTQNYYYIRDKRPPIQFKGYLKQSNIFITLFIAIGSIFLGLMIQCGCGLYLLEKFPRLFSGGLISHAGPTREQMNRFDFSFTLIGKGWKDGDDRSKAPKKSMAVHIKGTNPGYGATCTCLLQAALTILNESMNMPSSGGVFTPGPAFEKTSLIERANQHGVNFSVLQVEP